MFVGVLLYLYLSLHREEPFRVVFQDFAVNLATWELIVAISGIFLFYRLFKVYVRHKFEMQSIFKILFEAVSHRFGNYLATQKVNVEIAKNYQSKDALNRMESSLTAMESDFKELILVLKNLEEEQLPKEQINVGTLIKDCISLISHSIHNPPICNIKGADNLTILCELLFAKIIFSLLLDNAMRHSRKKVYIRYGYGRSGQKYCVILNDVFHNSAAKGVGLGLKLVHHFAGRMSVELKIKNTHSWFCCLLIWK